MSDILPTFVELGGGQVPGDLVVDGKSLAPLILGKETDSKRDWILAMSDRATLDEKGVRPFNDFSPRVIRDKRYKVWVNTNKKIDRLHDLQKDPGEEKNLLDSDLAEDKEALQKFMAVVGTFPEKDARMHYEPRAKNPWDKKLKKTPGTP